MKYTGERYLPGAWDVEPTFQGKMWQEHLARYLFGQAFVRDKDVLDVGCGVGYGTDIMVEGGARTVVGVDIAHEAVRYAGERYGRHGITFVTGDATALPFADAQFDVVVAFESIEHLTDPVAFVREAKRVLKKGGVFVVSTPRRRGLARSLFHTHEFDSGEFEAILQGAFAHVMLFGQNNCLVTIIGRGPRFAGFSRLDFMKDLQVVDSDYMIAVCGATGVTPETVAVVNDDEYVLNLERRVAALRQAEERLREELGPPPPYPIRVWRMYRKIGAGGLLKRAVLYACVRLGLTVYSPPEEPSVIDRALTILRDQGMAGLLRSARIAALRARDAARLRRAIAPRPSVSRDIKPPRGGGLGGSRGTAGSTRGMQSAPTGGRENAETVRTPRPVLRIGWIIPPPSAGSGGHKNIFRAVRYLARAGHDVTIYVHEHDRVDTALLEEVFERELQDTGARTILGTGRIAPGDVLFATHWSTAEVAVRNRDAAPCLLYFVQDLEPYFYPMSYEYIRAERTYRAGLKIITSGPWCARMLRERYGIDAEWFAFPVDRRTYYPRPDVKRERNLIAYLARPEMPRRLFPLGIESLQMIKEKRGDVHIILFGSDAVPRDVPFEHTNLGVVQSLETLARLYSAATVGVAFSATNPSLVPYELMACGCPVVDMDYGGSEVNYGGRDNVALVPPTPDGVAAAIERLLDDAVARERIARNGFEFVQSFPGEEEVGKTIEGFVLKHWSATAGSAAKAARREAFVIQPAGNGRDSRT